MTMDNEEEDVVPMTKPIRLLEMVICAVLVGLLVDVGGRLALVTPLAVMYVTFGGLFMITLVDVISQLTRDPIPDLPMFIFCLAGCALFLTSGGMSTHFYLKYKQHGETAGDYKSEEAMLQFKKTTMEILAMAVLSIINGVIFLVDAALIFRYG